MASNSPNLNSASISIQMVMITYIARIFHDLGTEQEEIELVWRHLRNTSMCHELTKRLDSRSWRLFTLDPNRVDSPTFREIVPCACEVLERAGRLPWSLFCRHCLKLCTTWQQLAVLEHVCMLSTFLYFSTFMFNAYAYYCPGSFCNRRPMSRTQELCKDHKMRNTSILKLPFGQEIPSYDGSPEILSIQDLRWLFSAQSWI